MRAIPSSVKTLLKSKSMLGADRPTARIIFLDKFGGTGNTLQPISFRLQRDEAAIAQRAVIVLSNVNPTNPKDPGYYTPYRQGGEFGQVANEWMFQILPSKRIAIDAGYGSELVRIFTGVIDEVTLDTVQGYTITLDCRDRGGILVDTLMTNTEDPEDPYWVEFPEQDVAVTVQQALLAAGFSPSDIIIENTGVVIDKFSEKETFADLIEWAISLTQWEFHIDEYGKAYFVEPRDRWPNRESIARTFSSNTISLGDAPIVVESEKVKSRSGTEYTRGVDYTINYEAGTITRKTTGAIASGQTVYIDYVYAAWVFKNGEDLYMLPFKYSNYEQYGKIVVTGNGCMGTWVATSPRWDTSTIPANKILFAEDPHLETDEECAAMAAKLGRQMTSRYVAAEFAAVAVPWLQVGDCIQIIEYSSTISEIYRIVSLEFEFSTTGVVMSGKAYHFGYAPLS